MVIGFFPASEKDWERQALKRLEELKRTTK
jgi:hypothetical protein